MNNNNQYDDAVSFPVNIKQLEDGNRVEYGVLYGLALSMKSQEVTKVLSSYQKNMIKKKFKAMSYNRIITFADMNSDDGRCFLRIFKDTDDFQDFLLTAGGFKVGSIIAFYEPKPPTGYISKHHDMPILTKYSSSYLADIVVPQGEVAYKDPNPGETRFFKYQGQTISVNFANIENTNCTGDMCDKQSFECSCPSSKMITHLVINAEVTFGENKMEVQSHALTKLLVKNLGVNDKKDDVMMGTGMRAMRVCINRIVNYVNHNGGWSLIGWAKTGEIVDQIDGEETLGSLDVTPHLIRTMPTGNLNEEIMDELMFNRNRNYTNVEIGNLEAILRREVVGGKKFDISFVEKFYLYFLFI